PPLCRPARGRWSGSATTRPCWPPRTAGWSRPRTSCSRGGISAGTPQARATSGARPRPAAWPMWRPWARCRPRCLSRWPPPRTCRSAGPASWPPGWPRSARGDSVLLAVTGLGDLAGRAPVLRSGAAPGDVVAVAGPLGHAAAGLALLSAGVRDGPLVTAHRRPAPPYDAGPQAADLGATAMIDISDGLLADLGHIADASGVLIDLSRAALGPDAELLAAASSVPLMARTAPGSPAPEFTALT